ncbi:tetratricopeptide repeat protein [Parendozoicomonas haliclonae]|uniref:Lipoprotein NlpI n=1 Tax=Parendozoicomonas haliclonae TaxID=1960125 RepID=A0A1X7ARN2_9GAMM|nr:tetratricopeptide repeat protein [Parendozoicomonas haliclonae]SMA50759.1 lipoprotein NlpI [Parendozoicomonas haliclonae]
MTSSISDQKTSSDRAEQLFYQGIEEMNSGRLQEAETALAESLQLEPAHCSTAFNLAICHVRQGNYTCALELFERTIELDPTLSTAYFYAGKTAALMNNYEDAITYFDRSLNSELPELPVRIARALALQAHGRMADAVADFTFVLEQEDNVAYRINRATCLMGMHDFNRALEDIDTLHKDGEVSVETLVIQFLSLKHLDCNHEALQVFEQLQQLDPDRGEQLQASLAEELEEARSAINTIAKG